MKFKTHNNIKIGIIFGICAGLLDVIPMIIQKLRWSADLSAFSMWIVVGFLIATSNLKIHGILKGVIISSLTFIPVGFLIVVDEPMSLIPILFFLLMLGGSLGYFINRYKIH